MRLSPRRQRATSPALSQLLVEDNHHQGFSSLASPVRPRFNGTDLRGAEAEQDRPGAGGSSPCWDALEGPPRAEEDSALRFTGKEEKDRRAVLRREGEAISWLAGEQAAFSSNLLVSAFLPTRSVGALSPGTDTEPSASRIEKLSRLELTSSSFRRLTPVIGREEEYFGQRTSPAATPEGGLRPGIGAPFDTRALLGSNCQQPRPRIPPNRVIDFSLDIVTCCRTGSVPVRSRSLPQMHGSAGGPYPPTAATFYHSHGHGRNSDSEVVASGFSPRVFNLHPLADHPSTAHKRQTSSAKGEHLPSLPPAGAEVAINIPASATWQDPSHARPGQVEERGQLSQPVPAESSRPLPEKVRPKVKVDTREGWDRERRAGGKGKGMGMGMGMAGSMGLVQSLRKFPGGAVTALQNSLYAALWRTGSAPIGRSRGSSSGSSKGGAGFKRAGSLVKSPTLKNIQSLSTLQEDMGDEEAALTQSGALWESRMDHQTLLSMGLFALVLCLWLFKGRPLVALFHTFPAEAEKAPPGSIWVELLALLILLGIVAALVRSAFPHLFARLRSSAASAAAAVGWDVYLNPGRLPGAFTFGWGKRGPASWGHRARRRGVGVPPFGEKRKSSFDSRGSWEYLGPPRSRDSPSASGQGSRSPHGPSEPSSPDTASPSASASSRALDCGVHTYSNGDRYEGEFYQGKCSGSGVYVFAASGRYEGDWVEGKYDGCGIETWLRGSRYRGQYRKGLREGYGVYRFYTGDVYAGMWSKGQSHGVGMQTCSDGSKYVGEFQWGAKHGVGKYTFRNGDTYTGEYFSDKMHGYGVYDFSNGHRYEGAWHEGRKQGLGIYTFRNGEERAGHWHLGALETRSTRSMGTGAGSTPTSPNAVNHSRVLHAVQEARRAAARAESVLRVEDRVSKAVSAANRAAVAARVAAAKAVQVEGTGRGGASGAGAEAAVHQRVSPGVHGGEDLP